MLSLEQIDLNLLRVFTAVMAERNVTRAARRLHLTQSATSNALARLRTLFEDELFLRGPQGVEPTALAEKLAGPIDAALDQVRSALALTAPFDPATAEQTVTVGVSEHAESLIAPRLVAHLRSQAPGMTVAFRLVDRLNAQDLLDRDEVALAIGVLGEPPARMTRIVLRRERFEVLMRPDHPLAAGPLTLAGYLDYPHLLISATGQSVGAIDRKLGEQGLSRRVGAVVSSLSSVAGILMGSDLVSTMAGGMARPLAQLHGLARKTPPVAMPPFPLSMIFHRRHDQDGANIWLRREITRIAKETVGAI